MNENTCMSPSIPIKIIKVFNGYIVEPVNGQDMISVDETMVFNNTKDLTSWVIMHFEGESAVLHNEWIDMPI